MEMDLTGRLVGRVLLSALLGALVGLEREFKRKPAGVRTNLFICLGSAMFTVLSDELSTRFGGMDHTRIAAQLIPGIGFIGAGAIIRDRGSVVGLTTAATIFVVASMGMAVGSGMYWTSVFLCVVILLSLTVVGWLEEKLIPTTRLMTFRVTTAQLERVMKPAQEALAEAGVTMQHFQVYRVGADFQMEFDAEVSSQQQHKLMEKLAAIEPRCEVAPLHAPRE